MTQHKNVTSSDDTDETKKKKTKATDNTTSNNATETGGSMSEGNLSNSRYGRERTSAVHDKTTITGSDTDGQVS